jgi:hypothetical protein
VDAGAGGVVGGGKRRLPMCLIRRWGEREDRTYLGIVEAAKQKEGWKHVAAGGRHRQGLDTDGQT